MWSIIDSRRHTVCDDADANECVSRNGAHSKKASDSQGSPKVFKESGSRKTCCARLSGPEHVSRADLKAFGFAIAIR